MQATDPLGKTYTITFDPMPDKMQEKMSPELFQAYRNLMERAQERPRDHLSEVEAFAKEHSEYPEVMNLLTYVCVQTRQAKRVEKLIKEAWEKHPDYFFAKVNYADQCLRKGRLDDFDKVFPDRSLEAIFPGRDTLHFSEFRGLMVLFGFYERARKRDSTGYLEAAKSVEPLHPSVLYLEKKLKKSRLFFRSKR